MRKLTESERCALLPFATPLTLDRSKYERPEGTMKLFPVQAKMLAEIEHCGGGIGLISVGQGKTLIASLAPIALGLKRHECLLLTKTSLIREAQKEIIKYSKHFYAQHLPAVSYGTLSRNVDAILAHKPKCIILDEADLICNWDSGRGKRFARYLQNYKPIVIAMSGTLIRKSIADITGFCHAALGDGSPVPISYSTVKNWSAVLDPFNAYNMPSDFARYQVGLLCRAMDEENPRLAFQKRLATTRGVTVSLGRACKAAVEVTEVRCAPSNQKVVEEFVETWVLPSGDELEMPMQAAQTQLHLERGYYYRPCFRENGVEVEPPEEYWDLRDKWNSAFRPWKKSHDTPGVAYQAMKEAKAHGLEYAEALAKLPGKESQIEILDPDYLVSKLNLVAGQKIVWYRFKAEADILEAGGLTVYRAGERPAEDSDESVGLSVLAHGTGLNLQNFTQNLLITPWLTGREIEQMLGRTHRRGQEADSVSLTVLLPGNGSVGTLNKLYKKAEFLSETTGQTQLLTMATTNRISL